MFVLGVDPGVSRCGYGCVESVRGRARATAVGVLTTSPSEPLPERLAALDRDLRELIAELDPEVVVVERLFFQANVRTAMSVGQASGLVIAAAAGAGCTVVQYTPGQVKQAVAGYGAAGKDQVQRMVQSLLGLTEVPRPPDAADALALALCHLSVAPLQARVEAAAEGGSRAMSERSERINVAARPDHGAAAEGGAL
jgi:crossover junction endodeoxyribonuclease RuvC